MTSYPENRPIPARRSFARTVRRTLLVAALGAVLLFLLYTYAALKFSYSEGERAGYVQKFAREGWICKTWEGEMAIVNVPGTPPEIFRFTVRDDALARRINDSMGSRVSLHYRQHVGLPTTCFGDTPYFVDQVRPAAP